MSTTQRVVKFTTEELQSIERSIKYSAVKAEGMEAFTVPTSKEIRAIIERLLQLKSNSVIILFCSFTHTKKF